MSCISEETILMCSYVSPDLMKWIYVFSFIGSSWIIELMESTAVWILKPVQKLYTIIFYYIQSSEFTEYIEFE